MVQNGYILHVPTAGLPEFLKRLAMEPKSTVTRKGILFTDSKVRRNALRYEIY